MAHAQAWHPCVTPHSHQRTRHRPSCCGRASLCGNPYMCAGLPFQHHRPQLCHIGTAGDAKPTTTHCTVVHSHCRRQRGQTPWWHVKAKAHSHVCRHRCVMRVSVVFRVGLARMFCSDRCTLKVQRKQRHVSAEHSLLAKQNVIYACVPSYCAQKHVANVLQRTVQNLHAYKHKPCNTIIPMEFAP